MRRRTLLAFIVAWPLSADTRQEIREVFASLAAALSGGDPYDFMRQFDSAMPGYEQFRSSVTALLEQNEVLTSIDPLNVNAQASEVSVETDWLLEIRSRQPAGPVTKRNEKVTCRLAKRKSKWKIVALEPQSLFAPPQP